MSIGINKQEKKDKIGERVAALQQLVSPFGKVNALSQVATLISFLSIVNTFFYHYCSQILLQFFRKHLGTLNSSMINSRFLWLLSKILLFASLFDLSLWNYCDFRFSVLRISGPQ
jgi:hypothetical protein